jgi:hypothetical protein
MSRLACASTSIPRSIGDTGRTETSRGMSPAPSAASATRTTLRPVVVDTVPAGALPIASRCPPWTRQRDEPCNASLPQRLPVERATTSHCVRPLPDVKSPHPERRSTTGAMSARVEPPLRRGAAQAGRFLSLPMVTRSLSLASRPGGRTTTVSPIYQSILAPPFPPVSALSLECFYYLDRLQKHLSPYCSRASNAKA